MYIKSIFICVVFLLITSCSEDNNSAQTCVPTKYNTVQLGTYPYLCNSTAILDINLDNNFTVLKSQDEFNTQVSGWHCVINFYEFNLIIGKISLEHDIESVSYDLSKDCSNTFHLIVTLTLYTNANPKNYLYNSIIPKLLPGETVIVQTIIK